MDDLTPLDTGIAEASAPDPEKAKRYAAEAADVDCWHRRIKSARKFDEAARKQYALDRRYARGDSGFEVDVNLVGTFVDILTAFLAARSPDVDVMPAKSAQPPSLDSLRDAAEEASKNDPAVAQTKQAAMMLAMQQGADPMAAQQAAEAAERQHVDQLAQQQFDALRDRYEQRQRDNKQFAETLELVITQLWRDGRLKFRARAAVRSALTVAVGWLKSTWQERKGEDPVTRQQINDLQDNLNRVVLLRQQIDEAQWAELDAKKAEYQRQLDALSAKVERVIARGYAIDFVQAEDIQVAPGVEIARYLDAPWIAHRIPMRIEDIGVEFKLDPEKLNTAKRYYQRKPIMSKDVSPNFDKDSITAKDADGYLASETGQGDNMIDSRDPDDAYGMVWEIWDRDADCILTFVEGIKCWVRPPMRPKPTSRFYAFFGIFFGEVDGQRHPQSMTTRSSKLVDEYNRITTAERDHRSRIRPKTAFNKGAMSPEDVAKIEGATTQEMVGIQPTDPNMPMDQLLFPIVYAGLDPALYDRSRIMSELERIWGVQEALSQSIQTDKTATEAQIQQTGFQARTGAMREIIEDMLTDLAQYTGEVAMAYLSPDDVRAMVGPDALWPEETGPEDLTRMVNVEIRAGSSGKPNTTAERQAWATLLPLLQSGIVQIGQLRNSAPADVADALETLLQITGERSGERLDMDQLIPEAGPPPMLPAGMPGVPPGPAPNGATSGPPVAPAIP